MQCLCGDPEEAHCPEHGCHLCPCFKFRPMIESPQRTWDRLVAEQMALLQMPALGKVQ